MRSRLDPRRSFRPLLEALENRALLSVCTVDRLTDVGEGKGMAGDLRYCIGQAQDGDSIQFSVTGTIGLTRALPALTRSTSIEGPAANRLTVQRQAVGGYFRIFTVTRTASVRISGLTIADGDTFCDGDGGGIHNQGTLEVSRSTLTGNVAGSDTICSGNGGGIYNGGTLRVSLSTLSENGVAGDGGGIYHDGPAGARTFIDNSTIANNAAGWFPGNGGGIAAIGGYLVDVRNSILANNAAREGPDLYDRLTLSGYNLIGNSSGGGGYHDTDLLNVNPLLGPLQDNGGPTRTHALLPGSPAIDAGDNTDAPEFDQRGLPRVTGNVIDIGAFEVQPGPAAAFSLYAPESAVAGVPFDLSVVAYDADGYRATTYTGTVAFFSSTDPDAGLPKPYTFTEADAGVVSLPESAVLFAEGLQEVGVYDVETFAEGLAYVEVFPGSAPGGVANPPWAYGSDVAALLALLRSQEPRVRL